MKDHGLCIYLFIHACDKHSMFANPRLLNLVGMQNMCGQVMNMSINREAGTQAREYYVY